MADRSEQQAFDGGAEAAVLSAAMLSAGARDEIRDIIEPIDFLSGAHRLVYETILELDTLGVEPDVVTVAHQLRTNGKLNQVGGTPFLASLTDATPTVANVLDHARIVRRLGLLRRMGATLVSLATRARAPETRADVLGFLEQCEAEVYAGNAFRTERETSSSLGELMMGAVQQLDPSRPREPRGLTTGFGELDELSLGLGAGELWYIAARPGVGKTALALGMARAVAWTGGRSAIIFSLEMQRRDLGERMLSAASGVNYKLLQKRELSAEYYSRAMTAAAELGRLPIAIDDDSALTPSRLRSRARKHFTKLRATHAHARPGIIVVDYVQLMGDDSREGNRNDQLERISRALKLLARELDVTIVALSQLNRPKDRAGGRPTLMDLRGSGALEQDADKVLFIHRDEAEGDERGDAELILGKGRNAGTGKVRVTWEPWCVRFVDSNQAGFSWRDPRYDEPESAELS